MDSHELKEYNAYIMEVDLYYPDDAGVPLDAIVSSNSSKSEDDWSCEAACFKCYKKEDADKEIEFWKMENRTSRNLANMAYGLQQQEKHDLGETTKELKATKRLLWLTRATRASDKAEICNERWLVALPEYKHYWRDKCKAWIHVETICRKKADSYL